MLLTGRLSRQPPWWLLFGVLAYVILFTVSAKSEDEIQPAPEEHVASTSQYHRAPSFQAAEAPPDSRVSRSTSSASFNFPKPPDSFPFSAQPATRAVKPRLTLSGLRMTRWQRLKARLQRSAVKRMVNVLKKNKGFEKRRRAKKFGPRRGEVEIRPVFQYTKEEAARGRPPKPPVLSKAEEIEVFNALFPLHRASRVAFLSTQTSFEPDSEVLAAEIRRHPMIEKARAEKLAAEAHARAAAAGGTGESSRPLFAIEPATNEETASEARVLPLGEGDAGVSIRPLRSTQHAPQVEPSLRSSTSQRVVTLSRTPSSEWDRKGLVKQAEKRIQQGLAIINDGLHVEALPRVHLRKRSPPDDPPRGYKYTQKHDYPGQHYRITLVKNPLSRDPILKEGKLSYHLIDPASVLSGEASMAKYWEDMSRVEREEIHQGVKKIWDRWWNVDYNKEPKRRVMSLPSNANGIRRINVPGKGPLLLRGYHDGYGNWLWEPRVDPKVKQPLVHEDNLPIHLKDFVKKGLGNEPYRILQYPAHMLRRSLPMTRVEKRSPAGSLFGSRGQSDWTKQKFTAINFHGNYLFTSKDLDGNYRFSTSKPTSSTKAFDYQLWTTLSDDQKKRVKKAIPNIEGMMSGNADVSRSEVGEVWKNEQKAHLFSDEGPETILVEKKQRWLPWLRPKFIFHRTDPATSRTISSSFKDLPDHLQIHLRESYLQGFKDVINHPLWKRADSPAEIGTGQPIAFHYPGQEVEVRKIAGEYTFGFPSNVKTLQRTEFLPWDKLNPKDRARVQWAYPRIDALVKGRIDEAAAKIDFEPGEDPEMSIARRAMFNDRPRTIWLIRKRHPFLRGREVMQFLQVDPLTGRLAGVPMQKLPFPVQSWFYETHRDVFDEAVESAKTYRLPLWRSAPTSVPSPKPFAPKSKFFRFEFEGQKASIYKLKNEGGFSYGLMDDAYPENRIWNKPWTELSAEQRDKLKTAVPDIEKLVNQEADAEKLGLKFKHIGIDHPAAIVPIPGQEPQSILLEEQKQGWLPFSRRKKLIFHRLDPETSKTISSSMEELPNYLQDYFRNNFSRFKTVIKHTLKKRADRDESNLMPLLPDHREASSSNWPAQSSNRPALSSSRPVGAGNMQQLDYPGRDFHIIKAGDKYSFQLPSGIAWNRDELRKWESMNEEQRQMVKERIPEIKRFLDNPTEDAKIALNFQYQAEGFPGLWSSSHSVPGQGKETILLERTHDWLQRPKLVFHRRDPSQDIYRPWSFEELPQHLKDWIEAEHTDLQVRIPEVSKQISRLRIWKRSGITPGVSDPNFPYVKLPSSPDRASSSKQAASRPNIEIFVVPGTPAISGGPGRLRGIPTVRIPPTPPIRVILRRKSSSLPPWTKSLLFRIGGRDLKFEELPVSVMEFFRKQHNDVFQEALALSRIKKYVPPMEFEDRVFTVEYPGEEIQLVRTQDGTYKFNFQTPGGGRLLRSRTWSNLPEDVKQHFLKRNRNIKKLVTGKITFEQAQSKGVRVIQEPTTEKRTYEHPTRAGFTFHIGRSTEKEIVIKEVDPHRRYSFRSKFTDLPDYLQQFLWEKEPLHDLLHEAVGSAPRLRKRAPPSLPLIVGYPGKKIVLYKTDQVPGRYVVNMLKEDGLKSFRSGSWADLAPDIQAHFDKEHPGMRSVAMSTMSASDARAQGIKVGNHPFDLANAYFHPHYPSEIVTIRRDNGKIVFLRQGQHLQGGNTLAKWSELPEHIQTYLGGKANLKEILIEAERSAHSLRKRMLPWRRKKKQYQASTSGAGSSTELEGVSVEVDFPMNSRFLPPAVSNPFQNAERPQHFRQFIYPGENGYDVLHRRDGYTFERIDLSQSSVHLNYEPLDLLPTKDQEAIRKLIPNIDEMIKQHTVTPDFVPSRSIHWFRHEAPADIWETKQDGWLMYTVRHLNDGGGYSFKHTVPFDQLPENLQRFIETAKRSGRSFVHK